MQPILLNYYNGSNFGDAMSPLVVSKISGGTVVHSPVNIAELSAIGSVLYDGSFICTDVSQANVKRKAILGLRRLQNMVRPKLKVWGSGFLVEPKIAKPFVRKWLDVRAVRGQVTKSILDKMGLFVGNEVALGDPGLLFAKLFGINPLPRYEIGVVPHEYDKVAGEFVVSRLRKYGLSVNLIDVNKSPEGVVKEIAACDTIISSSLHGLIVADSLGVANKQIVLSNLSHSKSDFELKFKDYYSAFGYDMPTPLRLEDIVDNALEVQKRISSEYVVNRDDVHAIQNGLMGSFPKELMAR